MDWGELGYTGMDWVGRGGRNMGEVGVAFVSPAPSQVPLGPRPTPPRGPPLTLEEWRRSLDGEGRSLSPEPIRERIFRGVRAGPKGGGGA